MKSYCTAHQTCVIYFKKMRDRNVTNFSEQQPSISVRICASLSYAGCPVLQSGGLDSCGASADAMVTAIS